MAKDRADGGIPRSGFIYVIFFLMIYAMFIGFKMSGILSSGEKIPALLKAAHSHTLLISVLLLFPLYDLRMRSAADKGRISGGLLEIILGLGLVGLIANTAGFSIAGLYPAMSGTGLSLAHAGQIVAFLAFFAYVIAAVVEEMYR